MTRVLLAALALSLAACGGEDDPEPVCGILDVQAQCPEGWDAVCPDDLIASCYLEETPDGGFVPTCIDPQSGDWDFTAPVWCDPL